jgi:hypothetical protein
VSDRGGDRNLELNYVTLVQKGRIQRERVVAAQTSFQSVAMVTLSFLEYVGARAN